jgi:hypothetical protein
MQHLSNFICLRDSEISFGLLCHGQFVTQRNKLRILSGKNGVGI